MGGVEWQLLLMFFVYLRRCMTSPLFPRESESREVRYLDGFWNFRADNSSSRDAGFTNSWFKQPLTTTGFTMKMPVPSSYNDITQDAKLRDFVGWVWYDREVFIPKRWNDENQLRVVIRFESCHYYCTVWINGQNLISHEGGHLPFEAEITPLLNYGTSNTVTVAVNNTLTPNTIPPGAIQYMDDQRYYPQGYFVQNLQMDFFNYAGIQRPVKLYTTPTVYLFDITLLTEIDGSAGVLKFKSSVAALEDDQSKNKEREDEDIMMYYEVLDDNGEKKGSTSGKNLFKGVIDVADVNVWWPVDMNERPGYMYTLVINVHSQVSKLVDIFRLPFGFRTIRYDKENLYINNQPFYFKGFGMHEDADIRGKGLDLPTIIKNFNLITWMGGNSFRTSHYPYADEIMDLADQYGIVVIDECPAVGVQKSNMGKTNLEKHKKVMKELIERDKNHPSVVMWSVANEPESQYAEAESYFRDITSHTRELDSTRPVTFVGNQSPFDDKGVQFVDIICYNHYYAWYHDAGHLELISYQLDYDLQNWRNITGKPFILSEYGADAVSGMHMTPPTMFSEDYQIATVKRYFPVFDRYRGKFFIGEMIWNFADFQTAQDLKRVGGNKKGIFTRTRQPKAVAHVLRERYHSISSLVSKGTGGEYTRQLKDGSSNGPKNGYIITVVGV